MWRLILCLVMVLETRPTTATAESMLEIHMGMANDVPCSVAAEILSDGTSASAGLRAFMFGMVAGTAAGTGKPDAPFDARMLGTYGLALSTCAMQPKARFVDILNEISND